MAVLDGEALLLERVKAITTVKIDAVRIRVHGDYHLGQVLDTGDDLVIFDFEGESGRPVLERRLKRLALEDVAGMLHSFQRVTGDTRQHDAEGERPAGTAPAVIPPLGDLIRTKHAQTVRWWQAWAARCTYQGPYREIVLCSALTLKLLTYAPSGAVIAAPTTSLPEQLGADLNWDYRYCWLRDAAFTLRALVSLGYTAEAESFRLWMLHATRLTWPEQELPHLAGYAGSRPVRIGNAAHTQQQLDVYGEVFDALIRFRQPAEHVDRDTIRMLNGLGQTVCERWQEPDAGIWELRDARLQHTHTKVLRWVALDRLIEFAQDGNHELAVDRFRQTRDAIRATIEARGYNAVRGTYTQTLEGEDLDASLLTLPLYGYLPATHPRIQSTVARIREHLAHGSLVYRYTATAGQGAASGEGAFGICSFWAVECLALAGDMDTATRLFEDLLSYANDVGLFAEQIDPATGTALGNFPQAFTHVGLINAALILAACRAGDDRPVAASRQLTRASENLR